MNAELPPLRASGVARVAACLGSRALEAAQPADERTADSLSGDKAHAMAADYFRALSVSVNQSWPEFVSDATPEGDCVEKFIEIVQREFLAWADSADNVRLVVEEEIILLGRDLAPILTGHPDIAFIYGLRAFVPDLKSLWGEHAESPRNYQLRAYALLIVEEYNVTKITTAIVQPRVSWTPHLCVYDKTALAQAASEIASIDAASRAPDAPLVPGDQCKFCRAQTVCPALHAHVRTVATLATREIEVADLPALLELCGPVEKCVAAIKAKAKREIEANPDAVPGWMLEEGATRRTVTDARVAFSAVSDVIDAEQFTGCCTVKISELETAFRLKTGMKVKDAKPEIERRLNGCIEKKQTAPSLARRKTSAT